MAGKVLAGKWKLVTQTAKGPFFSTYRAEPRSGGVPVAVKVLDGALAEDDDRKRRFLENAGAALSLTDRRLLTVREMAEEPLDRVDGKARRAVYAVVDAPGGPSLSDIVAKQGSMAPARAVACIRGLLEGLASVHKAGLIHGDLHPACVHLEPDGEGGEQVRVADAGLAQGLGPAGAEAGDPSALGSDGGRWLSPEQASGQPPTAASDIHAAGALLYFALTGTSPWQAEKGTALLFEIQRSFPRAATEVKLEIPEAMDGVVDRALAKAPKERFASAAEFARTLAQAASGLGAAPAPAVPDDITPGAMTLGAIPALDVTISSPRDPAPEEATLTQVPRAPAPRAPSGDETVIGTAAPARAPAPPPAQAPTAAIQRPAPAAPPKPAAKAPPPAKPAAKPAPARKAPPPPAVDTDETLPAGKVPALPVKPGKPAKVRGAWSVGTPVAVLAILGFLGVGALYGFVWAGYLDWKIPPWLRTLTGRNETAHVPDTVKIPPLEPIPMTLDVEFTEPEIRRPMGGEGADAVYGSWKVVKDPDEKSTEKVFASGNLAGEPNAEGVIPVKVDLPPGKYQLVGTAAFGDIRLFVEGRRMPFFEVGPAKPRVVSFKIDTRPTVLNVKLQPRTKAVVTIERGPVSSAKEELARGEGSIQFGLESDRLKGRLKLGETWLIKVRAEGYKEKTQTVILDREPTTADVILEEDPGDKVRAAKRGIEEGGRLPPEFLEDQAVLGHPEIQVALALLNVAANPPAWTKVEDYLASLQSVDPRNLPPDAPKLYRAYHDHLRELGKEAAARGDVVRVREFRAKTRPEVLGITPASEERKAWAELEASAWMAFPPATKTPGAPVPDVELDPVQRMVEQDRGDLSDATRKRLFLRILENRAWPAWRAGNELRPPVKEGEKEPALTVPGPSVKPWIDLATRIFPEYVNDAALSLSLQRLAARLEDLERKPENVVRLLAADPEWGPAKSIPDLRYDALTKKDRLLLARALVRWADLVQETSTENASKLRNVAWGAYQKCQDVEVSADPERDYPEPLATAALFEGARVAILVSGDETGRGLLDRYLRLRQADEGARKLRDDLIRKKPLDVPAQLKAEDLVEIPEGPFLVGSAESKKGLTEQPFRDPKTAAIEINTLFPPRRIKVYAFLVGKREVTWGQYKRYLSAMKDEAMAAKLRHPKEPPEKMADGTRMPSNTDTWGDADPVRGVDFWDAYACCQFLGGRLPTEAEWEKAARWCGRDAPFPDPMADLRRALGSVNFPGFWPDNAADVGGLDYAPSGIKAIWGGVAEWTLDPFEVRSPAPKDGTVEGVVFYPPEMKALSAERMCVRGGSFYHLAPGENPGDSVVESKKEPPPAAGAPPDRARVWRAMDLMERRGVPAGTRAKWLGFRVVVATPASITTAK
jgi:formylglycine-generating enzyme required for sulfatase activity